MLPPEDRFAQHHKFKKKKIGDPYAIILPNNLKWKTNILFKSISKRDKVKYFT
jgi:hypothetical protein